MDYIRENWKDIRGMWIISAKIEGYPRNMDYIREIWKDIREIWILSAKSGRISVKYGFYPRVTLLHPLPPQNSLPEIIKKRAASCAARL
jgi:uncharacterized protein YbdZ (MbtH family)